MRIVPKSGSPVFGQTAVYSGTSMSIRYARFGAGFARGRCVLVPEQTPAWLRGEDLPGLDDSQLPHGVALAVFDVDGRLLGRGKLQSGRLKNLLPRRLF